MKHKALKNFLFISLTLLPLFQSWGQVKPLDQLLQERDSLITRYHDLQQENNAFFGGKSKNDLRNIIGNLQKVINKDAEVVRALRSRSVKKQYQLTDKNRKSYDELQELQQENARFRREVARLRKENAEMPETIASLKSDKNTAQSLNIILILVIFGMGLVLWRKGEKKKRGRAKA